MSVDEKWYKKVKSQCIGSEEICMKHESVNKEGDIKQTKGKIDEIVH